MKDPIIQTGHAVLRQHAKPVAKKDIGGKKLNALLKRMSAMLKKEEFGVALAAPQVGVSLRLFIVSGKIFKPKTEAKKVPDRVFINPELIKTSRKKKEVAEGCLSVRGKYGTVPRHEKVTLRAQDEKGNKITHNASGLVAQIFEHEVDHLNGILYTDKATSLRDEKTHER